MINKKIVPFSLCLALYFSFFVTAFPLDKSIYQSFQISGICVEYIVPLELKNLSGTAKKELFMTTVDRKAAVSSYGDRALSENVAVYGLGGENEFGGADVLFEVFVVETKDQNFTPQQFACYLETALKHRVSIPGKGLVEVSNIIGSIEVAGNSVVTARPSIPVDRAINGYDGEYNITIYPYSIFYIKLSDRSWFSLRLKYINSNIAVDVLRARASNIAREILGSVKKRSNPSSQP